MSIEAGLVGLPNVGKSTLFNALTKSEIPAENYPFCTIDPHKAITLVPDERIGKLQKIYNSAKTIPATVSFVDIAGLVKGAASGEGLGNAFLGHIREVNLILHVVRCFEDPDIIQTGNLLDPIADFEIINAELMLKDLESIEKRLQKIAHQMKSVRQKPKELQGLQQEQQLLENIKQELDAGTSEAIPGLIDKSSVSTISLLCAKNFLIIANVSERDLDDQAFTKLPGYQKLIETFGQEKVIPVCAQLEYEITQMKESDAQEALSMFGLDTSGLQKIIENTYTSLGLITFFTCGPKEIHAWPIKKGITIREAAGEIHSDLERGFICADVFNYQDLIEHGSEQAIKTAGKLRTEGQDYIVKDGDIVHIKFNV